MAVYGTAHPITPGTPVSARSAVGIACSVAGTIRLVMADGTFFDVYATVGTAIIEGVAVRDVNAAGTNATATVTVLG